LEAQVTALRAGSGLPVRGIRKRASWGLGDIPFYDIALGPDLQRGQLRGHAKGIVAIGDFATGVLAIGGLARGVIALGGLSLGLVSAGGLSLGLLAAVGGLAIGGAAIGGAAVGAVAIGGGAAGYYACGGGAAGKYVIAAHRRDVEAREFFRQYGVEALCGSR